MQNPKLWWCNGLGEQDMYQFEINIEDTKSGKLLDKRVISYGIRSIELIRELDQNAITGHSKGRSFYFVLNSVPIYAKGANYVPRSIFQPNLTRHPEIYEQTI
jgi:beta-mannosidase